MNFLAYLLAVSCFDREREMRQDILLYTFEVLLFQKRCQTRVLQVLLIDRIDSVFQFEVFQVVQQQSDSVQYDLQIAYIAR